MKKQKQTEFDIRTCRNRVLHVIIGCTYGGEGYSGLTDGSDVRGKLTEIDIQRGSATILSDKLGLPCAVKLRSLYAL
jgi:microcystin-dependent protein